MKNLKILIPFSALIITLILGFGAGHFRQKEGFVFRRSVAEFETNLHINMRLMDEKLAQVSAMLPDSNSAPDLWLTLSMDKLDLKGNGKTILIYRNDSLKYWTGNSIPVSSLYNKQELGKEFVYLGNAWIVVRQSIFGKYRIVGLLLVKHLYPYENRFLENSFSHNFHFTSDVTIGYLRDITPGSYTIRNLKGENLFFMHPDVAKEKDTPVFNLASFCYLLSFFFFILLFRNLFKISKTFSKKWLILGSLVVLMIGIRACMLWFKLPASLYILDMFHPRYYASSALSPSLGDLIINSIFLFFIVYSFYTAIPIREIPVINKKIIFRYLLPGLIFVAICTIYPDFIFRNLVRNSRISFEVHNLLELNLYSFLALVPVALLYASAGLLFDRWVCRFRDLLGLKKLLLSFSGGLVLLFIVMNISGLTYSFLTLLLYILIGSIICIIRCSYSLSFRYSTFVLILLFFSLYSAAFSSSYAGKKDKEEEKVLVSNLAAEHDAVAELLLVDMEARLRKDSVLRVMMGSKDLNFENIYNYLEKKYFIDYWLKYDYQLNICNETDIVLIQPDNVSSHCYSFFEDLVRERGVQVPNTSFYFLDNRNGRISYFAAFPYTNHSGKLVRLYLELDSKLGSEVLGFPELLLDEDVNHDNLLSGYSYAKYYKGKLIMKTGPFPYSLNNQQYGEVNKEFNFTSFDRYDHVLYKVDDSNLIILSKPTTTFFDRLISFSYIFVFYFLITTCILLVSRVPFIRIAFRSDFKNRIQYSMISLLFLSLLLVGGGAIYFSIRQYQGKYQEILGEKIQSVYVELSHTLGVEKRLTTQWHGTEYDNLEELLQKFSNVFFTDINLYDNKGNLLASSRPEIFNSGLAGRLMDPVAYSELTVDKRAELIQRESIGKMNFISAYVPFLNNDGQMLAYLNLPYFTRQTVLSEEVSTLVIAVVNISLLLLLLSTAVAIVIANKIAQPLRLIQKKFGEIHLGKKYEMINYQGMDEIASLVNEYNRMVFELEQSVEMLAKSERESAWREMAKQVAHEIKNPLTPMKLSVQHLQRAWEKKDENFGESLKKFTRTIAEQVDNLSYIATAFSNFAMMPREHNEVVDFLEIARNTITLFGNEENVAIQTNYGNLKEARVFGDKEQFGRMVINLIKNAQQAIPDNRKGMIRISLQLETDQFVFRISDNGAGIPASLRSRMFEPNFTTKSGGTGLGLAIVKRIVDHAGGHISYQTEEGIGTTFEVRLPAQS